MSLCRIALFMPLLQPAPARALLTDITQGGAAPAVSFLTRAVVARALKQTCMCVVPHAEMTHQKLRLVQQVSNRR